MHEKLQPLLRPGDTGDAQVARCAVGVQPLRASGPQRGDPVGVQLGQQHVGGEHPIPVGGIGHPGRHVDIDAQTVAPRGNPQCSRARSRA